MNSGLALFYGISIVVVLLSAGYKEMIDHLKKKKPIDTEPPAIQIEIEDKI